MKNFVWLLLLTVLSLELFGQTANLVQIDDGAEQIRKMNLPLYFRDQNSFIVGADTKQLQVLSESKAGVKILAVSVSLKDYYLISKKDCSAPDLTAVSGNVIFNNGFTAIVKATAQDLVTLYHNGNRILQMSDKPIIVKTENLLVNPNKSKQLNPLIQSLTAEVRLDSITSYIQKLQDMQTRFCQAPNRRAVAVWIRNKFIQLGVTNAVIDSFQTNPYTTGGISYQPGWQYNVVATITGSENPDEIIVVGGHHDSIVGNVAGSTGMDPMLLAPGADDNASAVAACFENARVIIKKNYQPKYTIKFVTFAMEEHGLSGSHYYAGQAHALNENIRLMINHDMIAYNPTDQWNIRIFPYSGAEYYAYLCAQLTEQYTSLNVSYGNFNSQGSDSYPFFLNGFPAVYFFEQTFTPYYHTYSDLISTCNLPYCAEVIKGSVAMLIHNNEAPLYPAELQVVDQGNGNQLKAVWRKNRESDIAGYKIQVGTATGVYTQTYTTADTTFVINGLTNGTAYFVGVLAYDSDQNESLVIESSAIPRIIPLSPVALAADPEWHKIKISWSANVEPDVAGYNLYRGTDTLNFTKINQSLITTTVYDDNNISINGYRYYKVSAVDQNSNESEKSPISTPVIPVSLDKGIVVIDESANGSGTLISPNDLQQDQFFSNLVANCPMVTHYDVLTQNRISLSELGAYSTVIWHNQSTELGSAFNTNYLEIKKYLDFGGKLLISADKPGKLIIGNNSYPTAFPDLAKDYFGIDSVDYKNTARFSGGLPAATGFNYLTVDSTKALETNGFHLKKVETLTPVSTAEVIYKYDSKYASNINYGVAKGKPVGVLHNGSNYKIATLAIPLYYIKQTEAKQLVEYILKEKFGETVGISSDFTADMSKELLQNYPNPFNNSTVINFNLIADSKVRLSVYNIKGELVKNLLNQNQAAGRHQVTFDATDLNSGVYFYKLQTGEKSIVKKMILLK